MALEEKEETLGIIGLVKLFGNFWKLVLRIFSSIYSSTYFFLPFGRKEVVIKKALLNDVLSPLNL